MTHRSAFRDASGAAAVEFALFLPVLLVLLFGGIEAGHFVWTQHKLVEAVRDGARYASRLPIRDLCEGTADVMSEDTKDNVKLITRTGQLASATADPRVPGWTANQVTVDPDCGNTDYVNTGLYAAYAAEYPDARAPRLSVSAQNVQYPWMFGALGSIMSGISSEGDNALDVRLTASSHAAGIGL